MAKNTTPKRPKRKNGEGSFSKSGNGFDYRFPYKDALGNTKYGYTYGKTKEICLARAEKRKTEELGIYSYEDVNENMLTSQWAKHKISVSNGYSAVMKKTFQMKCYRRKKHLNKTIGAHKNNKLWGKIDL